MILQIHFLPNGCARINTWVKVDMLHSLHASAHMCQTLTQTVYWSWTSVWVRDRSPTGTICVPMKKGFWNVTLDYLGNVLRLYRMQRYVGSLDTMCGFPIYVSAHLYPVYLYSVLPKLPNFFAQNIPIAASCFFTVPSNICRSRWELSRLILPPFSDHSDHL